MARFGPLSISLDPDRYFYRPEEVKLCTEAAFKGDLGQVKKLVQQLLHDPRPPEPRKPEPAWLRGSLHMAIKIRNFEMVRLLLAENVAGEGDMFIEGAVRGRDFESLDGYKQTSPERTPRIMVRVILP